MTAKERVLTIRLMEKLEQHPSYAVVLSIETTRVAAQHDTKENPKCFTTA